jgi:hypothetical protein
MSDGIGNVSSRQRFKTVSLIFSALQICEAGYASINAAARRRKPIGVRHRLPRVARQSSKA